MPGGLLSHISLFLFFEVGRLTEPGARLAATKSQPRSLFPTALELRTDVATSSSLCGCWDPNSGPYTCKGGVLTPGVITSASPKLIV